MKPYLLKETAIILCILNLTCFLFIDYNSDFLAVMLVLCILVIGFGYWVLYKFWMGKNWARILVIIASVIALLNLILFQSQPTINKTLFIVEAIIAIFLLYWLNTKNIKSFFKNKV